MKYCCFILAIAGKQDHFIIEHAHTILTFLNGKGARAYEKLIASLLADKWSRKYSSVAGWFKARMTLAVVRSNTLLLRGSRTRYSWKPDCVDGFMAGAEGVLHED